jgi:hypothetical protein
MVKRVQTVKIICDGNRIKGNKECNHYSIRRYYIQTDKVMKTMRTIILLIGILIAGIAANTAVAAPNSTSAEAYDRCNCPDKGKHKDKDKHKHSGTRHKEHKHKGDKGKSHDSGFKSKEYKRGWK